MSEFMKFNRESQSGQPSSHSPAVTKAVFVGDLSFFCTEIELAMAFSPFGDIGALEIKRGRYGDSLMHGFVEYTTEVAAQKAIVEMNGKKFMGRQMRVNRTNVKVGPNPGYEKWVQIHVNFQSPKLTMKVTEEFLESVFCTFGSIGDITVKRHLCSRDPAQVTGYAFVYFLDAYAALRAIHAVKGVTIDGVTMECCLTYRSEQALMNQAGVANILRAQQQHQHQPQFKHQSQPYVSKSSVGPMQQQYQQPTYHAPVNHHVHHAHANKPVSTPSQFFNQHPNHQASTNVFAPSGRISSPTQSNNMGQQQHQLQHRPFVSSVNNYHGQYYPAQQPQQQLHHHHHHYQNERELVAMTPKWNTNSMSSSHHNPGPFYPYHDANPVASHMFPSLSAVTSTESSIIGIDPRSSTHSVDSRSETDDGEDVLALLQQELRSSNAAMFPGHIHHSNVASTRTSLLQDHNDEVFALQGLYPQSYHQQPPTSKVLSFLHYSEPEVSSLTPPQQHVISPPMTTSFELFSH